MGFTRCAVSIGRLGWGNFLSNDRILAWLVVAALVALGTADVSSAKSRKHASSAARSKAASSAPANAASSAAPAQAASADTPAKSASTQRKKSAAAARKKHKKELEKVEAKRPGHVIDQAAAGEAAPLPPALTSV